MGQVINNPGESVLAERVAAEEAGALEARVFRSMVVAVALAVVAGALLMPWRVTTGLLLGGILSLLNHRWLRQSIATALNVDVTVQRPRLKASGYILRYFFVFAIVALAYKLNIVSLTATIVGLCSFVAALFVEAFRQSYFAIIHREESN
jgi:hypothetical protein